jgi:tetratricopeptide (TPR) repeat protein/cold shock CspA family protein
VLDLEIPEYEDRVPHNLPEPEFDETGFLGRAEQVERIEELCLRGGHPVITIFGDGGVGKTSLALKVAYDLLDHPDASFDSVVWATSKTTTLTAKDVVSIENAITDSLGLISELADSITGEHSSNPAQEVIEYLREFRLLLVVDNLETVLDGRLRDFLAEVPAGGSKILLTSRIGVGAYEHPVPLQPMTDDEAIVLLRTLAESRGVQDLVAMENKRLVKYCGRMKNNPLWIKWFVSGVHTGERPEALLAEPARFLDYAMTNVYDYLSEESRRLLEVMHSVSGPHSQAQLVFLSEMEPEKLQRALLELATTNMIQIRRSPTGSSFESRYALGDLARTYLSKHHPVPQQLHAKLRARRAELISAGEDLRARQKRNPYLFKSLDMSSASNLVVARHLLRALEAISTDDFAVAGDEITSATQLAPEWFEVHRVAANLETRKGNYPAAQDRFEAALELAPESAPLRLWYGLFLLSHVDEHEDAKAQYSMGIELDPESLDLRLEFARASLYLEEWEAARSALDYVLERDHSLSIYRLRKLHDLNLQYYTRRSERLSLEGDLEAALELLLGLRQAFEACPSRCVDEKIRGRLEASAPTARRIVRYSDDETVKARAAEIATWAATAAGKPVAAVGSTDGGSGVVCRVVPERGFGFIRAGDGGEVFFHVSRVSDVANLEELPVGSAVRFEIGTREDGRPEAVRVVRA